MEKEERGGVEPESVHREGRVLVSQEGVVGQRVD